MKKEKKMKKMMMAVAGLAMAVALTGCGGGSPKGVAEKFVLAIIQKDPGKAIEFYDDQLQSDGRDFTTWNSEDMKKEKTALEAAIAATPSTIAEYQAAVDALNAAVASTKQNMNANLYGIWFVKWKPCHM